MTIPNPLQTGKPKGVNQRAILPRGFSGLEQWAWEELADIDGRIKLSKRVADTQNRVLMYHSVGGSNYGSIPVERFRNDIAHVTSEYQVVDLPEVVSGNDDEKQVALTFDDGLSDFYSNVLPILREFDVPATVFVISRSIYDSDFSHDRNANWQYMTRSQLCEIADEKLVAIGNHTRTHPILTAIESKENLEAEIIGAKTELEEQIGVTPSRFSYPGTWYDPACLQVVRRSHDLAVIGTEWIRMVERNCDPCLIPRVDGAQRQQRVKWELTDLAAKTRTLF